MKKSIAPTKENDGERPALKQTDKPWKGNPEPAQFDPERPAPDLEKWKDSKTH